MKIATKKDNKGSFFTASSRKKMLNNLSPFAIKEAYNMARVKLLFTSKGEKCPVYAVTSTDASDGKTINAINFAISFAMAGKRTLIIDGDMRNPSINKYFQVPRENGLSEVLAQITSEINIQESGQENLYFVSAGEIPPNPSELIGSEMLESVLACLTEQFDYIFIDTPPVGLVSDAAFLAEKVTGYLLVVRSGYSDLSAVRHSVDTLQNLNGNIVGFLLNDVSGKGNGYYRRNGYRYSYNYSYGEATETDEQEADH